MTDRSKTVVMLIDWDNLQICHSRDAPGTELDLYALIALAQSYGTLVSARAYAEWNFAAERLAVYKAGIEPVFAPVMRPEGSAREGKSLADTVMVAEGVDLLWTVAPDVFVLVTSDKDMIPLARIAKQRGAAVVVLGSDLTAIPLVEMSNVFITYRQLLRELDRVAELDAPSGRAPARERRVLREARRSSGDAYRTGSERRGQGGGMRAVAAPSPVTLAPAASVPVPSAPVPAPPRREEPEPSPALTTVAQSPGADVEGTDVDSPTNGEGAARRRRRRGGRGRGRSGEYGTGGDRLQEIEAALMAGLPLNEPLPAESLEAMADEADAAVTDTVPGESESARADIESTSTERPSPTPSQPAFGRVRRGVAFSEFGAPSSPWTAPPTETIAEPNDASVGPAAETSTDVSVIEPGAATEETTEPAEATAAPEPTIGDAAPEPMALSLVPTGATAEDVGDGAADVSAGGTTEQAAADETGRGAEAAGESDGSAESAAVAGETTAAPSEENAGAAEAAAEEPVEPAPKPTRRRRTRRTPAPAADAANG